MRKVRASQHSVVGGWTWKGNFYYEAKFLEFISEREHYCVLIYGSLESNLIEMKSNWTEDRVYERETLQS